MRLTTSWTVICVSLISLLPFRGAGQSLDQTILLADRLYTLGMYEEAIPYYERALYFSVSQSLPDVTFRLAESLLAAKEYERAMIFFDEAYHLSSDPQRKSSILFNKALVYLETNNPGFALIELLSMRTAEDTALAMRKSYYLGAVRMRMDQYNLAEKHFIDYCNLGGIPEKIPEIQALFADTLKFKRMNPRLAGYFSLIIPGSGQFYAGAYPEAINSFLLVGSLQVAFIYISANYGLLDAYLGIFPWWQRYYSGGYKAAKKLASEKKNKLRDELYLKILNESYFSVENGAVRN
jgi:tetratricopeptide (TPR) repeat protein